MAGDWIKLHRKLTESAVFKDSETLHVWIYILTHANWKDAQLLDGTWLRAGELITSRDRIAKVCKMSPHKAYRRVHALKNLGQIDVKTHNKGTHIKVLNWGTYQHDAQPSAQQAHSQRTASAQQAHSKRAQKKKEIKKEHYLIVFCRSQNTPKTKLGQRQPIRLSLRRFGTCGHGVGVTTNAGHSRSGSGQSNAARWPRLWKRLSGMQTVKKGGAIIAKCRALGCMVTGGRMTRLACTTKVPRWSTSHQHARQLMSKPVYCSASLLIAGGS